MVPFRHDLASERHTSFEMTKHSAFDRENIPISVVYIKLDLCWSTEKKCRGDEKTLCAGKGSLRVRRIPLCVVELVPMVRGVSTC